MREKPKTTYKDYLFVGGLVIITIAIILAIVFAIRWFGAVTMQDRIVTPRAGVECLVVSAHDGVGVSCYHIPKN